jgi:hypothetical protein
MGRHLGQSLSTQDVVRLYADGHSTMAIATALGCSNRTVQVRLQAAGVPMRRRGWPIRQATDHPNWKGDDASYSALHKRVETLRGTPSLCAVCGTTQRRVYHWANLTGHYADPQDYARMCVPCHRRYDAQRVSEGVGL